MKNKIKFGTLALVAGISMSSQAFAVAYQPNIDETIKVDRIESLIEYEYTEADSARIIDIYLNGEELSAEDLKKYDIDQNGIVNANDAAMVYDLIK